MIPSVLVLFVLTAIATAQKDVACSGVQAGNFVRNSAACQSYYYCNGKIAHAGQCPPNYLFNSRTQACSRPANVDCTECSPFGIQHLEDPISCNHYYRCVNGQKSRIACAPTLSFNLIIGECTVPTTNNNCDKSICAPYSTYVKIGDPKNCTHYYSCLNGKAYKQECAPTLYYNCHSGKCQLPATWNFCQGNGALIVAADEHVEYYPPTHPPPYFPPATIQPPATQPPATLPPFVTGTPATVRPPPAATVPPAATQRPPPVTQPPLQLTQKPPSVTQLPVITPPPLSLYNCPDQPLYSAFPHPQSCHKFISCKEGIPVSVDCVALFYWNDLEKRCMREKPAHC